MAQNRITVFQMLVAELHDRGMEIGRANECLHACMAADEMEIPWTSYADLYPPKHQVDILTAVAPFALTWLENRDSDHDTIGALKGMFPHTPVAGKTVPAGGIEGPPI